jgi:hypothetical protein
VRLITALLVLVLDPLAVLLTLAAKRPPVSVSQGLWEYGPPEITHRRPGLSRGATFVAASIASFYEPRGRHAADPGGNAAVGKRFAGFAARNNARIAARRPHWRSGKLRNLFLDIRRPTDKA